MNISTKLSKINKDSFFIIFKGHLLCDYEPASTATLPRLESCLLHLLAKEL